MTKLSPVFRTFLAVSMCLSLHWSASAFNKTASPDDIGPEISLQRSSDNLFTMEVTINGSPSVPMIVDTAAAISGIRPALSQQLSLPVYTKERIVHGLVASESASSVHIQNMATSMREYEGPSIIISDSEAISDPSVMGIVGMDFLSNDKEENRYLLINFLDGHIISADKIPDLFQGKNIRNLQWNKVIDFDRNLISFEAKISKIKSTVILDTGINFTVANGELARQLQKRGNSLATTIVTDVHGEEDSIRHINIGEIKTSYMIWSTARALVHDSPAIAHLKLDQTPTLLMGLNHLKKLGFILDRKKNKISFVDARMMREEDQSCTGSRISCSDAMWSHFNYNR
ncbi:retropepsin-like aspartic protease [Hirschia litorea]|uniref:Retropepsin-like aspartic protease n=1 Tax=Hirschia litorea TaxID=1199156 RepID=A0ABW2IJQ9_9PROT